jgi:hypothetical protein
VDAIGRRGLIVFGVLAMLTAAASLALARLNVYLYSTIYNGADTVDERLEALRQTAAMLQTSGFSVGQLVSLFLGIRLARRPYPLLAVAGGAGLAVVALAMAVFLSSPAGRELLLADLLDRYKLGAGPPDLDAHLWSDGALRAIGVGLVEFPLWALLGVATGRILGRVVAVWAGLAWYVVSQMAGVPIMATSVETASILPFLAPTYTSFTSIDVLVTTAHPLVTMAAPVGLLCYGSLLLSIGRRVALRLRGPWSYQQPPP